MAVLAEMSRLLRMMLGTFDILVTWYSIVSFSMSHLRPPACRIHS
jgi:hypothetical protein